MRIPAGPIVTLIALASLMIGGAAHSAAPAGQQATFAGGCFWCVETAFEGLRGVKSVISGYAGGSEPNPTYEQVSSGATGHAEAVQITFDPGVVSYAQLVDLFWRNIDPTQADAQFCDHGRQYRSAIYYHDETQKRWALASKRRVAKRFREPIVTEIEPLTRFWPAEAYHQDFYRKDPVRYRTYRQGCGRDQRLKELWGAPGRQVAH